MPLSLDLSLPLMAVYWSPTMPPPIILGFRPNSLADCTMPTEPFGYEQITTSSGLVAVMARMIGEQRGGVGEHVLPQTFLKPYLCMFSRAPSAALRENSASSAAMATVCGFGFCAAATSKKPSVNDFFGVGPDGSIEKYFG